MESKILNLYDGMKLAQILSKYITLENDGNKIAIDFIEDLVNKIEPQEYLECINLFVGGIDKEKLPTSEELIEIVYTGMRNNNIFSLLETYKAIGFH